LAAHDFSTHSYRALRRAAALSRQWGAKLVLLHVVQRAGAALAGAIDVAGLRLHQHASDVAELANSTPEVVVRSGSVVRSIAAVAEEVRADLVILGTRRTRAVRDLFVDRTTARVLRAAKVPVLLVNRSSIDPYGRVLIATDLSHASIRAAQFADALSLLDEASVSVLHAFMPFGKTKLIYAGVRPDLIAAHVKQSARNALKEVVSTFRRDGLNVSRRHVILADDHPVDAIRRAVKNRRSDLLVIGTRGHTGIKRALLGSTAGEVLRTVKCDVLTVPPQARVSGDSAPVLQERDSCLNDFRRDGPVQ
jgi:nucleotide-binding universal stress UspA family protein